MRSQIVIIKDYADGRGHHSKYMPYAFTEQGLTKKLSMKVTEPKQPQRKPIGFHVSEEEK